MPDEAPPYSWTRFRDHAKGDSGARIVVDVEVGPNKVQTEMVVDTGATWIVLDPEVAEASGIAASEDDRTVRMVIRGIEWSGRLARGEVVLLADEGDDVVVDGSFFIPDLDDGDVWRAPSFLGWSGCLERVRFAVDPQRRRFSFAAADADLESER